MRKLSGCLLKSINGPSGFFLGGGGGMRLALVTAFGSNVGREGSMSAIEVIGFACANV